MNNNYISSVWNFNNHNTTYLTHDFLRWYGKLVPQLVERLLLMYSGEKELVLANFAGSGTVPLECLLKKRDCIAYDTNPLAILLSKVKTNPIKLNHLNFVKFLGKQEFEVRAEDIAKNEYEKKWFNKHNLGQLKLLRKAIQEYPCGQAERDFLLLAFASIIRKSSLVDSRCINHIVLDKNKKSINVIQIFKKKLREMAESIIELQSKISYKAKIQIKQADARNLSELKNEAVDLIIAHPPYLGNVDYTNINQLENYFLGHIYGDIRQRDISTNSLAKYLESMYQVIDEMYRIIKSNRYACIVIGDNRKDGEVVPTFSFFIQHALKVGFKLEDIFIWVLNQKAGMNIKRHGNHIDHNYILVFKK